MEESVQAEDGERKPEQDPTTVDEVLHRVLNAESLKNSNGTEGDPGKFDPWTNDPRGCEVVGGDAAADMHPPETQRLTGDPKVAPCLLNRMSSNQ